MTDPARAAVPADWYPDTSTPGQLRRWDGAAWTEHTTPVVAASPPRGMVATRPALPADRPVYSVFIWLLAVLPLVGYLAIFAYRPTIDLSPAAAGAPQPGALLTPGYFLIIAASWLTYALNAVLAWRDVVWLRRQGVVRPFAWPFVFISSIVYVIGRSVIVHRVAGNRGRAPMVLGILVLVAGFILVTVWSVMLISTMVNDLGPLTGPDGILQG